MQPALSDFRIESDSIVQLTFSNGSSYRVGLNDLERYLSHDDVAKIRHAFRMRNQFMRRILPPMAMVLLVGGILALGTHDMQRVRALIHPPVKVPVRCVPVQPVQAATAPAASKAAIPASSPSGSMATSSAAAAVPPPSSNTAASSSMSKTAAPAPASSLTHQTNSPGGPVSQVVTPVLSPVLTPVAQTVQAVTQPVTKTVGGVLRSLP